MDRWGCIRFPDLPLQVALLRLEAHERDAAFAVVRDEKPSSPLLFVNPAATKEGLRPGMRYTAALSVVPTFRVAVVTADELAEVRSGIVELLAEWSPRIEPCPFDNEVFWIDASGLSALHGAPERWGARLRDHLAGLGYRVDLVIGWSRRGSYVLVRSRRRSSSMLSPEAERRAVAVSPVGALPLSWPLRDLLQRLGVTTVAELDRIPAGELARRLGREALAALDELATSRPLQPVPLAVSTLRERRWDDPVSEIAALKTVLWELFAEELVRLRPRARLVASITFEFLGEDAGVLAQLAPAQPTANARTWERLLDLRLESLVLKSAVTGVRLDTVTVPPPPPAADLFDQPPRDLKRGGKALALIRARWGNDAAVRAVPADEHAPEAAFTWEPVLCLTPPQPSRPMDTAVRRVFDEPRPAPEGRVLAGPFVFQAGGDRLLRRYWLVRGGSTVLWLRQDGWTEPQITGVVD